MNKLMKTMRKGQTMVEYILVISLIAVALIATFTVLKNKIADKAEDVGDKIEQAGED